MTTENKLRAGKNYNKTNILVLYYWGANRAKTVRKLNYIQYESLSSDKNMHTSK